MIYFEGGDKAKNLQELLELGFSYYAAYCAPGMYKFKHTFLDKECTRHDCWYARRSFGDLLEITQTYFPETTEEDLAYSLIYKLKDSYARLCHEINKVVFYKLTSLTGWHGIANVDGDAPYKLDGTGISFNHIKQLADSVQNRIESAGRRSRASF